MTQQIVPYLYFILTNSTTISDCSKFHKAEKTDYYKTFLGGNLDFPKIKIWKKIVMLSKPEQKCENFAIFKQSNTLKLFVAIKWPIHAVSA